MSQIADFFSGLGRHFAAQAAAMLTARTIGERYSIAHSFAWPVMALFILAVFFLDKGDQLREKLVYIVYFVVFVELVVFATVFAITLIR